LAGPALEWKSRLEEPAYDFACLAIKSFLEDDDVVVAGSEDLADRLGPRFFAMTEEPRQHIDVPREDFDFLRRHLKRIRLSESRNWREKNTCDDKYERFHSVLMKQRSSRLVMWACQEG